MLPSLSLSSFDHCTSSTGNPAPMSAGIYGAGVRHSLRRRRHGGTGPLANRLAQFPTCKIPVYWHFLFVYSLCFLLEGSVGQIIASHRPASRTRAPREQHHEV